MIWLIPEPENVKANLFYQGFHKALNAAIQTVQDKSLLGRDLQTPLYEKFPHGLADLTYEIWTKATRLLGAEQMLRELGSETLDTQREALLHTIKEEAKDLIAYAGFVWGWLDAH